jgi:hypothetical protein
MEGPLRSCRLHVFYLFWILTLGAGCSYSQTFTTTGGMAEPLICQTATALHDGTVLITGGTNGNYFDSGVNATKDAELYGPNQSAQSFAPTGSMNVARNCGSNATLLNDGTVLITGGSGNTTAELYIPSSRSFSLSTASTQLNPQGLPIGPMNAVRYHATATLLQDGTVLIAGGDVGDNRGQTSSEIYNPATGTFTATTGVMSTPRTTHTATLLRDGTVLIAGGQGNVSGQTSWNTAEIYNPTSKQFTTLAAHMTAARAEHTATLLPDGTVLLAGGDGTSGTLSSAEIYTSSTSAFTPVGNMNSARMQHTANLLADGTVLIAGGFSSSSSSDALLSAEIYNVSQHQFTLTGNLTAPRAYHSATLLFNGDILVAGGLESNASPSAYLSSAELYSYPVTMATLEPAYKVTSIIYAPPGNKSQAGYTSNTSNATTTTIGSTFGTGNSISMSLGFSYPGVGGISASESFATSSTSSNSSAFQETYTNATGVANQSNSTAPDAINHNNDLFLIWLNPQITAFGDESAQGPVGYSVGVQPLANGTLPVPDIVEVTASAMEANSSGMTTVPKSTLNQEPNVAGQLVPGLASICKNLNKAEYAAQACTLADQCGCTANDFVPILQQDPLLFSNGLSNPISPFSATASPLIANVSDVQECGTIPATPGSNCRYVPVPSQVGSTQQAGVTLAGPLTQGGNTPVNSFQQGENIQKTYVLGGQTQTQVQLVQSINVSLGAVTGCNGGLGLGSCSPSGGKPGSGSATGTGTWGIGTTMTWTDNQSVGTANASGTTLALTLSSSTVGCEQNSNIGVFEDTIYHTFVFQQPPGDLSTCTTLVPGFYVTATPNNPSQTALSLGHSISYNVQVSAWNGFNGTVALSASGLPAGVTASFSPPSIATSGVSNATLTLTAAYSNSTYIGTSQVTVTGASGAVTQAAVFPLTTQPLQYRGYCSVQ